MIHTPDRVGRVRGLAVAACGFAVAGTLGIIVASAATGTGYGYVSEAGVDGAPQAGVYRAGVFAVAVALALLAGALKPHLDARTAPGGGALPDLALPDLALPDLAL